MEKYTGLEIAVIGLAGRFPEADTIARFWENLVSGRDCISELSDEEILEEGESEEILNDPLYVKSNAYLKNKKYFDATFFNYRLDEAELMDPQTRIFHECCWEALEDSGYTPSRENKVGIFASGTPNVPWVLHAEVKNREMLVDDFTAAQLRDVSFLCSRISYKFNLRGPAIYIQTACSSSLVAIHEACNSLLLGECSMALAGGVHVQNYSRKGYIYKEGMIRSRDGKCRPFAVNSNGTVGGEGAGVVVLKKLRDAIHDRDNIYAVIKGTAINNDGNSKVGYTAPSVKGQAEVIKKAYKIARIKPESVSYIETHGTATELGDPIEIEALNTVFGSCKAKSCAIGAVKSNIGHLDSAAGVAGFIKTVLAIKHKLIPPSLYFNRPNPKIDFDRGPFFVNDKVMNWENALGPLRAGVSSFGIGGTNAHVVLEEPPEMDASAESKAYQLIVLSAKTQTSLARNTAQFIQFLEANRQLRLPDIAYTLQTGRDRFRYRKMLVCGNIDEAIRILSDNKTTDGASLNAQEDLQNIIFMFSGQGAQYANMCRDLYVSENEFRDILDDCLIRLKQFSDLDFRAALFTDNEHMLEGDVPIDNTKYTQPLLFVIEYSLCRLLMKWGIRPDYMIGHSIGEYVAACISGVFILDDALRLVVRRGELMSSTERGCMLAINMNEGQFKSFLTEDSRIDLAVVNTETSLVVAGTEVDIRAFEKLITDQGFQCKKIRTSHAFHSYMMDGILREFEKEFSTIKINEPVIPYISNNSGDFVHYSQIKDPQYWSGHLRNTVHFHKGTEILLNKGDGIFIEIGPGRTLCNYIAGHKLKAEGHYSINIVRQARQDVNDQNYLIEKLGLLWLKGVKIDWNAYYFAEKRKRVPLPAYSFERVAFTADFNLNKLLNFRSTEDASLFKADTGQYVNISDWKRTISPNKAIELVERKYDFIVFCGKEHFSDHMVRHLRSLGQRVIEVRPANCLRKINDDSFEVNFSEPGDFTGLWKLLEQSRVLVSELIYCVALSDEPGEVNYEGIGERLTEGYLGLSYIAKCLAGSSQTERINFTIVGNHLAKVMEEDQVDPLKATIHSPVRIMPSEITNVRCKLIDIPYPFDCEAELNAYLAKVENEIFYEADDPFVAYRFKQRWIESFDTLVPGEKTASNIEIVEKGTYIISGGFGGIGFSIAEDLVHRHGANVVIVYRSDFPERKDWDHWLVAKGKDDAISKRIWQVRHMESSGCSVDLYQLDVTAEQQVQEFANGLKDRYAKINGLIWAAGEVDYGGIILKRTQADFIKYSSSKIHGLLLFEKYLEFGALDFLALFSSVGNVIYQVKFGQVGYNAANEFLEHYAYYARKKFGIHAFTINWCDWLDVGLTVKAVMREQKTEDINFVNSRIAHAIYPDEGISVFNKCLANKASIYNIYKGDIRQAIIGHRLQLKELRNTKKQVAQPDSAAAGIDSKNILVEIYTGFFGIDVQVGDDFFELGGDSLKAMSLVARINQKLGIHLTISDLYRYPTINDMLVKLQGLSVSNGVKVIPKAPVRNCYLASSEQKRMYFLQMLDEASVIYNETEVLSAHGKLDKNKIESIFTRLIERHESLRTSFVFNNEKLWQYIATEFAFRVEYLPYDPQELDDIIQSFIRPFDLNSTPLLRVGIIEKGPQEHLMIIDSHHIVMDGVSRIILRDEFNALYNDKELPELHLQYKDYAEWQQSSEQQELIKKQREFWINEFAGTLPILELPTDFPKPLNRTYKGDFLRWEIGVDATKSLRALATSEGTTVFTVLLSVFNVLLSKLGNSEDIVIGIPVAGRQNADLESIIGMFVNTLSLRNYPKGEMSFREFISDIKTRSLAYFENQSYQFEELVNELKIERDTGANPLFNVMLVYQNYEESKHKTQGLTIKPTNIKHATSRFDLTLLVVEENDQLFLRFIFSTELFRNETVQRFIGYFQRIISVITDNADRRIKDIEIIPESEKRQLVFEFNDTRAECSLQKNVIDLFHFQVKATPNNFAVKCGGDILTYQQLNNKASAVAHQINARVEGQGHRIGLLFYPSIEMVACILGVMKSGCSFVPLSPDVPDERNSYILKDCGADLLLVQEKLYHDKRHRTLFVDCCEVVVITEKEDAAEIAPYTEREISPEQFVYIIYTSGTTGKPKGVGIKHNSLANYVLWNKAYHKLSQADVSLQLVSYHFDGFGANAYPILLSGGILVIIPEESKLDAEYIVDVIRSENITNLALLPGLYGALLDKLASDEKSTNLRFVVLAGEKATGELVKKHLAVLPEVMLENEYGPTEATIGATHHRPVNSENPGIIGKPVWNTSIYILGKRNELLPIGVKGEICISGQGVAQGYVNNQLLTSAKFLTNPFDTSQMIYRTGDVGRWLADGNIEISGRIDDQVKIRGYRIELGEIEGQLARHDQITQAVVIANGNEGQKYLVAYYVSENKIAVEVLKGYLSGKLPEYMIPSYYVRLNEFPYTLTGKLNRKALPDPEITAGDSYIAPMTKEEKLLADVWSKILGVEHIGIMDNFFSIGGDSIKSIQICSRLRGAGYEVTVRDIFTSQTIKQLSIKLKEAVVISDQSLVKGWVPLTPIQRWFFEKYRTEKHHFNQSVMLLFPQGISEETVRVVFKKLQEHHDALRMVFREEGGKIIQQNEGPDLDVSVEVHDLTKEVGPRTSILSVCDKIQSGIDLEKGPLVNLGLFHVGDGSQLLIVIHHLVVDGISWRILFEDIETLYQQVIKGLPLSLPLKTDSYQRWSNHLSEYAKSKAFQKARPYWSKLLGREVPRIKRDNPDGSNVFRDSANELFSLTEGETKKLLTEAHAPFNTQINDILLTALLLCMQRQYGHDSVLVDIEGHGREEVRKDVNISRTVGWFTSIYPVLLEKGEGGLSQIIKHVKETLREVPNNGIDYLVYKYLDCSGPEELTKESHAQISFNYLGQFDADIVGKSYTIEKESSRNDISLKETREYDWHLSGIIAGAQLTMQLSYSKQQYTRETISTMLNIYKECLQELIEYCCTYRKVEVTPSDLTFKDLSISELDELSSKYDLEDIYPLSPMQEGMLFHSLLDADSSSYFQQMSYKLKGNLDIAAIEKSMNDIIARYDVLRTVYLHKGYERPIQIILKEKKIYFEYKDVRKACLDAGREEVISLYQKRDKAKTFDLSRDVLMRLLVLQTAEDEFEFIWSHHHVLMDGWCMGVIVDEFSKIYAANKRRQKLLLPSVTPYSYYIKWLENRDKEASSGYWANYLKGYERLASLPKRETAGSLAYSLASEEFSINSEQTAALYKISGEFRITINTILQSVWGIILSKYNNVNDVVFGSVVSGRPAEIVGIEKMVGLFINTIPVRIRYTAGDTFIDLLHKVQDDALKSEQYQYSPLFEIQSLSDLGRELLDHIIVFEDYPLAHGIESSAGNNYEKDYTVANVQIFEQANYDLMLVIIPGDTFQIRIDYNVNRYEKAKIVRVLMHFAKVIEEVILNSKVQVPAIEIITENEKRQILDCFNNTAKIYPAEKSFVEIFEGQVLKNPGYVAAVYNQHILTYKSLNEKANQLARYLHDHAGKQSCIPVLVEPSTDLLVCMLGIFKAGMVYVPINIDAPLARIIDNISDLDATILITKGDYLNDYVSFYDKITVETKIDRIIFYDDQQPRAENVNLFKTYRIAAELLRGRLYEFADTVVLHDGKRDITGVQLNENIARLTHLISREGAAGHSYGLLLSNPVLKIVAILTLRGLNIPFQVFGSEREITNESIENVSALITENAFNDATDSLFWEASSLQALILLDRYDDAGSKKEDAFRKIWNHVAEDTTEAINDYGWSSSYTGESFSIREMEEYVNNFKIKLQPYLTPQCRMLEIGCGHGILLFELAPKVGYYHATDLAERILQKNRAHLQRAAIGNVGLEAFAASEIKNVSEKNYDVIVCSSVVHYFPDTIYLERLIKDSIELIRDEGIIYLDDLMDLSEKQNLIESTRQYKKAHPDAKVKTDWTGDLFIGRDFFDFLHDKYPEIVEVTCSRKTGLIENELTKYRYDAIIKINKAASILKKQAMSVKRRYTYEDIVARDAGINVAGLQLSKKDALTIPENIVSTRELQLYPVNDLGIRNSTDDISYIIYTSGTTGKPKGAMIHHGGMLNHLYAKIGDLSITEKDIVAQTAPASFDISIWQFLACLLTGGQTCIIDKEKVLEPRLLLKELQLGAVTIFESVPSLLTTILDELPEGPDNLMGKLRWMIPTGEPLTTALVKKWYFCFPDIKLMNAYGPTEASDDVTHHVVEYPAEDQLSIPIGKPVQNMNVYVLDGNLNLCPIGVKGELCIAGIGVGKGYWKDDNKTNKAFVPNPFKNKADPGSYNMLYKTGDIGYYLENGDMVCKGRMDSQVKIRGFRIELGEIESLLAQYHLIREVVVIAKGQEADKYLVAYYVAQDEIDTDELKRYLGERLVAYMVPPYYVQLKSIPLTPNGKVDRKALPEPKFITGEEHVAPSNSVEHKLAEIWSEVLNIEKETISVKTGFFELGGHSLKATVLANKIQKYFEVEVPLKEIFNKQNIENLADYLMTVKQIGSGIEADNEIIEIAV